MKFKYLTKEELQLLENELLQFLIVNGIDGPEWERINTSNPEKAVEIVGLFSDLVWQRSLEKVKFGEKIYSNQCFVFAFHADQIEMYQLLAKDKREDLLTFDDFAHWLSVHPGQFEIRHQTKNYKSNREEEIFFMMNNGLLLSDYSRFEFLQKIYNNA